MDTDNKPIVKNGPGDDLHGRIKGLEQSKTYPGMTPADIAALDRVIDKLKQKLADQNAPREQQDKD